MLSYMRKVFLKIYKMRLRQTKTHARNTAARSYETWLKGLGIKKCQIEDENFVLEFAKRDSAAAAINRYFKEKGFSVSANKIVLSRDQLDIVKEVYAKEILKFDFKAHENLIYLEPAIAALGKLTGELKNRAIERSPLIGDSSAILEKYDATRITLYIAFNYKILSRSHVDALVNVRLAIQNSVTREKLKEDLQVETKGDDIFEIITDYFKKEDLTGFNALVDDMKFAFAQYKNQPDSFKSNLASLNEAKSGIMLQHKEEIRKKLQQDKERNIVKHDTEEVQVKQHEKDSYPYMHVREDGSLTIMVPFTGGELISTDNTCKTGEKFSSFSSNIKSVIDGYIKDLKDDIDLLGSIECQQDLLNKKAKRLEYLKKSKKFFGNKNPLNLAYIKEKFVESNGITVAHAVPNPDPFTGFNFKTKYNDALSGEEKRKEYTASFRQSLAQRLFSSLDATSPENEVLNYESILESAKEKYKETYKDSQSQDNIGKIDEANLKEKITELVKSIKEVVHEKIDSKWEFKDDEITDETLKYYKDVWCLDDGEDLEFLSVYTAFMDCGFHQIEYGKGNEDKYNIWKKLELALNSKSFYENREKKDFVLMAQIFVTSLTAVYYQESGLKVDFAEFIQEGCNLDTFISKIQKSYNQGKSFVSIVDKIINPALEGKSLTKIDSAKAEQYFRESVFFSIYGSPHYDEFLLIPNGPVKDARINFCSFGGAISCSIDELGLPGFEYKKFEYDNPSIGHKNEVGSFERTLNLKDIKLPKEPEDIARLLALQGSGDDNWRIYHLLDDEKIEELKKKDIGIILKHIDPYLSNAEKTEFKNKFGINNTYILTSQQADKMYNIFLMYCENGWPDFAHSSKNGNATRYAINSHWVVDNAEKKLSKILTHLEDKRSSNAPKVKCNNGLYCVEYKKEHLDSKSLLELCVNHQETELFFDRNLAEACYRNMDKIHPELNINQYNNEIAIKFIKSLEVLFPNLNIKPNIPPYSEMYDREMVLVSSANKRGYILKCQNPETLNQMYEVVDLYREELFEVKLPKWIAHCLSSRRGHDLGSLMHSWEMLDYPMRVNELGTEYTLYLNNHNKTSIFRDILLDIAGDKTYDDDRYKKVEQEYFFTEMDRMRAEQNASLIKNYEGIIARFKDNSLESLTQEDLDAALKMRDEMYAKKKENKWFFEEFLGECEKVNSLLERHQNRTTAQQPPQVQPVQGTVVGEQRQVPHPEPEEPPVIPGLPPQVQPVQGTEVAEQRQVPHPEPKEPPVIPGHRDLDLYVQTILTGALYGMALGAALVSCAAVYNANITSMTLELLASTVLTSVTSKTGVSIIISAGVIGAVLNCVNEGLILVSYQPSV
jgi:hypothetical protein